MSENNSASDQNPRTNRNDRKPQNRNNRFTNRMREPTQNNVEQRDFPRTGNAPLKIIPIGGTTTVQKNMYIYESGNDIMVIDCGIGFPDSETPGVDVILPDFTYILERRERVKGVVISHGHNDHISSLPYLLKEYPFDVYAVPFVKDLIEQSLLEHKDLKHIKVKAFDPNHHLQLGVFKLTPFKVNHSIPDTLGFAIDTPQGRVFHCADFKFDWSPYIGKTFDIQKAATLASEPKEGVLCLLSDCLGATSEGFTRSEKYIQSIFEDIISKNVGRQIFITTISSNVSRIQQAINASIKYGRKIVLSGRSINTSVEIAIRHGYIKAPENMFVSEYDAHRHHQDKLTYIITGSYGQENSSLYRLIRGEHKSITFKKEPLVVFSADPIPSSLNAINSMIDELFLEGVEVYYSQIQDNLHVSGHGAKGDLTLLVNIVNPKFFIPIGGNIKHMRAYSKMIKDIDRDDKNVLQLLDGQTVIFENGNARLGEKLKLKEVYVDGTLVGDVGTSVIEDRLQMANDGIIVIIPGKTEVDIVTRGFIFPKASSELIKATKDIVKTQIKKKINARNLEHDLERFFYKQTGRNPIVIVHEK